jgi:hypothetical protein
MKKKEVIVYWCPFVRNDEYDWNMFYPEPKNLYSELLLKKAKTQDVKNNGTSYFSCSAFKERSKNIFTLNTPIKSMVRLENGMIADGYGLQANITRSPQFEDKTSVTLGLSYGFFCEEPLTMHLNPPFLHQNSYTQKTNLFAGGMDISKWFRPINIEFSTGMNETVEISSNTPLAYVEFITDKKVILKRFEINDKMRKMGSACALSVSVKRNVPLYERYKLFVNSKQDKILLKEIKKNLVE